MSKHCYFTILSLFLVWTGCRTTAATQRIKHLLTGDIVHTWAFYQMYDPYDKGITYSADPARPRLLALYQNGDFVESDNGILKKGKWQCSPPTLLLSYPKETTPLQYEIKKLVSDTLRIAIQGRHGMVETTYIRQ